jgi:hypothetical protein
MATRDFVMLAAAPGANVESQASYAGSGYQVNGQQPGIVLSQFLNKGTRQGTAGMAVLAQFIINAINESVVDTGYANEAAEVSALTAQFEAALAAYIATTSAPAIIAVASSAAPNFAGNLGNLLLPVFEFTLTANAVATFSNFTWGQRVTFIIHQNGTGGYTFTWPGTAINVGAPDPAANSTSVQECIVDAAGNLIATGGIAG